MTTYNLIFGITYRSFWYAAGHRPLHLSTLHSDENAADRKFFAEGLKQYSPAYRIFEASDGESGLALYRSQRIDCVLLELNFPDQSGFGRQLLRFKGDQGGGCGGKVGGAGSRT